MHTLNPVQFKSRFVSSIVVLMALILLVMPGPVAAQDTQGEVKIEWLTWSFFRITSPTGKVILTNPWLSNPDSQTTLEQVDKADIILVAAGHRDEVGETVKVAVKTGAKVITTWEMAGGAFKGKIPDDQLVRTGPGSTVNLDGIKVRVMNAVHGSGGANALYGGPALGFMITFENDYTIYFSGSTDVTMDMQLWGSLFKPDTAILYFPSGMAPGDVAQMARLLSADNAGLKTVIPHHQRVAPPPGQSPDDLAKAMVSLGLTAKLLKLKPGEIYTLPQ